MSVLDSFLGHLVIPEEPYDYDQIDWRTFRPDESIWSIRTNKVPVHYVRMLTVAYDKLMDEMKASFPLGPKELVDRYNELHADYCELQQKLAYADAKNKKNKHYLKASQQHQTSGGLRNEILQSVGMEEVHDNERPKENNRFVSNNGESKNYNSMLAAAMRLAGFDYEYISEKVGIKITSVPSYITRGKKHYTIFNNNEIHWDKEYGGDVWKLDELFPSAYEDDDQEYDECEEEHYDCDDQEYDECEEEYSDCDDQEDYQEENEEYSDTGISGIIRHLIRPIAASE